MRRAMKKKRKRSHRRRTKLHQESKLKAGRRWKFLKKKEIDIYNQMQEAKKIKDSEKLFAEQADITETSAY